MPITLAARMTAKIMDAQTVQALASAYALVDPTASFATVLASFNSWLADVDALSDGQIISAEFCVIPTLPTGIKTAPLSTSRVEQTGVINFLCTGTTHRWAEAIPALSNGATVISGGKIVLTSGDPAANLISLLTTGTAYLEWTNDQQQVITALKDTLITFWQYNRQLSAATFETPVAP